MAKGRHIRMESLLIVRFVLPLFIILTMSLVVGFLIYQQTSSVLEEEVKASNRLLLEQGMTVLDKRWEDIDTQIRRITDDLKVIRLQQIDDPFDSANLYRTIEARGRLQEYYNSNELIMNYFLIFKNSRLVLNNDYTSRLDDFSRVLRYPDQPEGFLQSIVENYHNRDVVPAGNVTLQGTKYELLTYLRSFGFSNYSNGTIIVLIKNDEITKLFKGFNTDGSWIYIADEKGNMITSVVGPNAKLPQERLVLPDSSGVMSSSINGEDMLVTYVASAYNGWTYVAAQPSQVVLQKITYIKNTTITIFLLFLTIGGLIGVYMTYRSSMPIRKIIHTLANYRITPEDPKSGAFGMISQGISMLMTSNQELQSKMERQLPFLRAAFFERLLRGQFQSDEDMEAVRTHVRVDWTGEAYLVAVLTFPDRATSVVNANEIEYLNQKRLITSEIILEMIPDVFLHDVDVDKIALIMQFTEGEPERIYRKAAAYLESIQLRIQQQYSMASIISVGNQYSQRMDITRSFLEAQQALIRSKDNRLIWFKEILPNPSSYYYPENMETRLINLVRTGNEETLTKLLSELQRHNFVDRNLPVLVLKVFLSDFAASVYKISGEIGEVTGLEAAAAAGSIADKVESIEAHYIQLKHKLEEISRAVRHRQNDRQQQRFQDIMMFVDDQYCDLQLSLAMLADRFSVTETYLSRMFKEKTGINFFDYLEGLRIGQSKQLLLTTALTVGDIAQRVGYSSSNTFGRAFKRTVGISALAFRNGSNEGEGKN
jgi:two-component system response regulator YesN